MIEELTPRQVWEALMSNPEATLCDVRHHRPNGALSACRILARPASSRCWCSGRFFPNMQPNPKFMAALAQANVHPGNHVYFLCRSGGRSMASAQAAKAPPATSMSIISRMGLKGRWMLGGIAAASPAGNMKGLPWKQG